MAAGSSVPQPRAEDADGGCRPPPGRARASSAWMRVIPAFARASSVYVRASSALTFGISGIIAAMEGRRIRRVVITFVASSLVATACESSSRRASRRQRSSRMHAAVSSEMLPLIKACRSTALTPPRVKCSWSRAFTFTKSLS